MTDLPTKTTQLKTLVYPEQKTAIVSAAKKLSESSPGRITQNDLMLWALAEFFAAHPELGRFPTYSSILRAHEQENQS